MLFNGRHHIVHLLAVRQLNEFNRLLGIYNAEIGVDERKHINILAGLENIPAPFPRFSEACIVLEYFLSHKKTLPFLTPVNSLIIKRYREVVHRPRDLSMIRTKMTQYTEFDQFTRDMRLVFSNAMLYNAQGSSLHNIAVCLLEELECKLEELERAKETAIKREEEKQLEAKETAMKREEEQKLESLSKGKEDELKLEILGEDKPQQLKTLGEDKPKLLKPVIVPTSIAGGKKVKAPVFKKKKKKKKKKEATKAKKEKSKKKSRALINKKKKKTLKKKRSTKKAKKKKAEVQGRRSKRVRNQK